jgi:hypothetical protein
MPRIRNMIHVLMRWFVLVGATVISGMAGADSDQSDLAKAAQNPIANLISQQLQFLFPK